jgi:hypothetical protein
VTGEGKGWVEFFTRYFPSGRNSEADAKLPWEDWRVGLRKDETPLLRIAITHGQPNLHWQIDMRGALVINLESMWDDFEYAVDQFISALAADSSTRLSSSSDGGVGRFAVHRLASKRERDRLECATKAPLIEPPICDGVG